MTITDEAVASLMEGLGLTPLFKPREVRAALEAALLPSDGNWVLMPREPTLEMLDANVKLIGQFWPGATADESEELNLLYYRRERAAALYGAMLAASPSPSVAPDAKSGRTEE
jgi:hypothetical protein